MDAEFVNKYNMVMNRVKQIENFDGSDPAKLPQFLTKIEAVMPSINSFDEYYKNTLLGHIKAKCTDRAKDMVLQRSGGAKVTTWLKLKELLLHNYAEKEASYALIHKLRTAVLDTNIEQYYQKLSKLKQRVLNRKLTHNDTLYSVEDIERISLQVFRDHLPEPTHSMILRRNPKSMEEAYRYIVEVQQQYYTQSGPFAGEQGATYSTSYKQTFGRSLSTDLQPGGSGGGTGVGLGGAAYGRPLFAQSEKHAGKMFSSDYNKGKYGGSVSPGGAGYFGGGSGGNGSGGSGAINATKSASPLAAMSSGNSAFKFGSTSKQSWQAKDNKTASSASKSAWRK